jgi:AcrR family transcriptional regulator
MKGVKNLMTELSPRERRYARTRQEILDTALELLNESGPEGLSLREIARRVDYSPAGLYEYFDSKAAIVDALCLEADRRLRSYLKSVPTTLPPDEYLVELGLAYVRYARDNRDHFLLRATRLIPDGPQLSFEEIDPGETFGILLDGVQAAIDAGIIQTREGYGLNEIAYSMWALGHGLATLQLTNLSNVAFEYERADRAAIETFIKGWGGRSEG